ncbi:MAG: alpha/beta fold hydrolase [Sandaracinaceae bacterium]|nr:alpha/beta fold hydrolase [Sandaracinaceae bacterium]
MRVAYLHGFASSPKTKKGLALRAHLAARGIALALPDLNAPSFRALSFAAMLERVDRLDAEEGDDEGWILVGSSLGGWLAARWAERRPARVRALLLLCPAFDVAGRWAALLPPGALERWRREGALPFANGAGELEPVHYAFFEEAGREAAFPAPACPTCVLHGVRDERVPIESSRAYAAAHPNVTLVEVDDGHELAASLPIIEAELARLLA